MDFHNMIGKLRAIESLGDKPDYVAEDAPESAIAGKCNMTAEGKSCPVHGMDECWSSPMEESDAATLAGMLKNSGQIAEAGAPRPPTTAATPPTAQDSGETWADWFSRIFGGGQTVATGGEIQGADTSGGVSGNPMGDYTGDPNSTPTTVKPAVEPTVADKPFTLGRFGNQAAVAAPKSVAPTIAARPAGPAAGMPAAKTPAAGVARPDAPAAGMPAAPEPTSFKDAFRAARKAAGGAGGVFMWKGKPYQTNVKGEPAKAWNSPDLKKVGSGWPTSESARRRMKTASVNEAGGIGGGISGGKFGMMKGNYGLPNTQPGGARPEGPAAGMPQRPKNWMDSDFQPGGARPEGPAAGMPAAPNSTAPTTSPRPQPRPSDLVTAPTSFKEAFRAARKAAGGAGGVFMWKGKPYQTNVKGEPAKAWNSPDLKKVGSGWPTSESVKRKMKSAIVAEAKITENFLVNLVGDIRNAFKPGIAITPALVKELESAAANAQAGKAPTPREQKILDTLMSTTLARELNKFLKKAPKDWNVPTLESTTRVNKKYISEQISTPADVGYRKSMSSGFAALQPRNRYMLPTGLTGSAAKPAFGPGTAAPGGMPSAKPAFGPGTVKPGSMPSAKPAFGPGTVKPGSMPAAKPSYGPGTVKPGSMPAAKPSYGPGTVKPGSMPASGASVSSGQAAAAERIAGNNAALATKNAGMMNRGLPSTIARTGSSSASISGTGTPRPAATGTLGAVRGGDTRMGAASTGKLPGMPSNIGKPTGLSVEYNDEEWYQFTGADGRTRYVGSDSGLADKATRARLRGIMKPDPVQFNKNNSEEASLALTQMAGDTMGTSMNETVDRMRELAGLSEMVDDSDDQAKVDDMAADMSADAVDEMVKHDHDDDMSSDMTIEDLMRKYGVDDDEDEVNEDAPLVGMPFTSLGATNNGPEEWGMVVTGGTNTNNFNESKKLKEGFTINSNMVVTDGKATKSLTINATDEDVDTLATMLRNAGMGSHMDVNNHSDVCDDCGKPEDQCTCGMNQTAMCSACNRPMDDCECGMESDDCGCGSDNCTCGMTMENADHDYGHDEKSELGEPLDVEDYVWDGPHLNQRFGKIGDNTLMAERAITLFKNYSDQYSQMLEEADLDPSNAGFDSPLTANSRDEFDKDPFVDETPVDDGSRSPLSTVKRQDVMEKLRKLAKILETTQTLYRIKVLSEAATKQDADALSQAISNFQTKAGIPVTGVLDSDTSAELDAALNSDATADTSMSDENSAALDAQIAQRTAQKAYQSALNAPNQSAAKQAQNDLYANQMSDPESMGWSYAEPDTDDAGNTEMTSFPSIGAANAKVNYYQPGEEAMIAGQPYVRDIDDQNKKVWVPAN